MASIDGTDGTGRKSTALLEGSSLKSKGSIRSLENGATISGSRRELGNCRGTGR